jgi:hypothetical protein
VKSTISLLLTLQEIELNAPEQRRAEAETLREQIPPAMLSRFDKFLKRGKKGVARVEKSVCKACQIAVPVGTVSRLIQGLGIEVCGNCGCYLYLPDADAVAFQAGLRIDTIVVQKAKPPALVDDVVAEKPLRKKRTYTKKPIAEKIEIS